MEWIIYFSFALIAMSTDALICVAFKKKYNVFGSFIMSLVWPIAAVFEIYGAHKVTKNYDKFDSVKPEPPKE